jgi:hypothetical protein
MINKLKEIKLAQKRLLLIISSLYLFTNFAYGQYGDDKLFYGGVILGTNFTQVDGDNFAGYHKVGINGGFIVYAKLGQYVAASMELLYAQKGARASNGQLPARSLDQSTVFTKFYNKLNYAEIPIMLNYFDEKKSNFGAGFSYSQLVSSKESYTTSSGAVIENGATLYPFRKYDLNFLLNGNAALYKGLFLNLRFAYSLISIRNGGSRNLLTTNQARQISNNIWTFRLMYMF